MINNISVDDEIYMFAKRKRFKRNNTYACMIRFPEGAFKLLF